MFFWRASGKRTISPGLWADLPERLQERLWRGGTCQRDLLIDDEERHAFDPKSPSPPHSRFRSRPIPTSGKLTKVDVLERDSPTIAISADGRWLAVGPRVFVTPQLAIRLYDFESLLSKK